MDSDISDDHGVTVTCEITDMGSYEDKHLDVVTKITRETASNFAHLIYDGPLQNQVEAVVRIYPPAPLAFGKAIIALNDSGCSGNKYGGSPGTGRRKALRKIRNFKEERNKNMPC